MPECTCRHGVVLPFAPTLVIPFSLLAQTRGRGREKPATFIGMVNTYCRKLVALHLAEGKQLPVGGEALNALYENTNPPLCFCVECRKQGSVRHSDVLRMELVVDLQAFRPISDCLTPSELCMKHDVGLPATPSKRVRPPVQDQQIHGQRWASLQLFYDDSFLFSIMRWGLST